MLSYTIILGIQKYRINLLLHFNLTDINIILNS